AGAIFGGQQYFAVGTLGSLTLTNFVYASADVHGAVIPTSITPPILADLSVSANGEFRFHLTATPGINYAIQVLTNLLCGSFVECWARPCPPPYQICSGRWKTLFATNAPCGSIDIVDADSPNFTHRFYRAIKQ